MKRTNPSQTRPARSAIAAGALAVLVFVTPVTVWAFNPLAGDYTRDDPKDVRIMTYNHNRNFISDPATDAEFNRILVAIDPDVAVMQEFPSSISQADVMNRFDSILPLAGGASWQVHFGLLGGIRTVIISRHPLLMTRIDTIPASDTRGVTIALVDLPDADYPFDVYLMGVHLKCCGNPGGSEDQQRQNSADAMANWLGDARGVVRPSGDNVVLPVNTPVLMLGDFNMVGGPQPEMTLLTGNIQDEATYGPDVKGDWDNTDVTNLMQADPFTGDTFTWQGNGSFPPSALDRIIYTDSAATIANSFILNTDTMTTSALAAAGLQAGDTLPQNSSDHLPSVVDLRIAMSGCLINADCDDGFFCNGAETCDTNGICQPGSDPCPGNICNDVLDECGTCAVDADCDDQNACTTDTCVGGACINVCPQLVSAFPYTEDFETGLGLWSDETTDDFDWTRNSGTTPSSSTGPSGDHTTGAGFYVYTEASTPNNPSMTAILNGPCFDLTGAVSAQLTFWYHMFGADMGTLSVEASTDCTTWTPVFSLSGDQGNSWQQAVVSLDTYTGSVVSLRISGLTGAGFRSDMAVDDIMITMTPGCTTSTECDNGLFCDGAEQCVASVCVAGTPPPLDDGIGCTVDACDEINDMVTHVASNGLCPDDGMFCNGVESCDPVLDCISSGDPCMAGLLCVEATDTCEPVPGDLDGDLDVDLADYALFAACLAGPDVTTPPVGCSMGTFTTADLDADGDVDLTDGAAFFDLLAP